MRLPLSMSLLLATIFLHYTSSAAIEGQDSQPDFLHRSSRSVSSATGNRISVSGKQYFVGQTPLSWFDAKFACEELDMELLTLDSAAKQQQIASHFSGQNAQFYWISGSDIASEGSYVWETTGSRFSFTSWRSGSPSGGTTENCAEVWFNFGGTSGNTNWDDYACSYQQRFICE